MNKYILFALLGIFALAGCENPINSIKSPASGTLVLTINTPLKTPQTADSATARTIHPDLDGFTLELSFEGPEAYEPVNDMQAGTNPAIDIPAGTWTITATARIGELDLAQGSARVTVAEDAVSTVSIILGPTPEGLDGTFSYYIVAPAGATGSLTIQTISGDEITNPLTTGNNQRMLNLSPGEYMFFVDLAKDGNHAGRTDVLHIYSELTSEASYIFTDDDFIVAQSLAPVYADFTGVVGSKALPTNAAEITAAKGGNNAVFTIEEGTSDVATINAASGELTLVGPGEISVSLVITTAGGVETHIGTSSTVKVSTVTSVTVSPPTKNVTKGGTATFIATVIGINSPDQTVTWRVIGGVIGTSISEGGVLSVADNESATTLTVRATSTAADTKNGTATVTVTNVPLDGLEAHLDLLSENTAANPRTVTLASSVTIDTADASASGVWATINRAVRNAGKYVILDLSACAAVGNIIEGNVTPTNNYFNIIQDNEYIKGVTLPSSLTSIGSHAFFGCSYLNSVPIGDGVTSIGSGAFAGCSGLTAFTVTEGNVTYLVEDGILYNKAKTTIISVAGARNSAVDLPDSLTSIGSYAFYGCADLASVIIPDRVTIIGSYAFYGCTGLTSVSIPDRVTGIGADAFYGCTGLISVSIPDRVTSIEQETFSDCTGLTSVTIGKGVISIGSYAFEGCSNLSSVIFGAESNITTEWDNSTFSSRANAGYYSGTNLWDEYNSGNKAGTYTRSGATTWRQEE
jgi:hypothetical protein